MPGDSSDYSHNKGKSILIPPKKWRFAVAILLGILCGLVIALLRISNAASYLSEDPEACVNCHIMTPQYATWMKGSHARVATCNDCHVPHDNFVRKYWFKAQDGMRHATIFTLGTEPQVIRIKEAGKSVVQDNCIRCHNEQVHPVSVANVTGENYKHGEGLLCWSCHRQTPHGRVHSLSSTPHAKVPALKNAVPDWIRGLTEEE